MGNDIFKFNLPQEEKNNIDRMTNNERNNSTTYKEKKLMDERENQLVIENTIWRIIKSPEIVAILTDLFDNIKENNPKNFNTNVLISEIYGLFIKNIKKEYDKKDNQNFFQELTEEKIKPMIEEMIKDGELTNPELVDLYNKLEK